MNSNNKPTDLDTSPLADSVPNAQGGTQVTGLDGVRVAMPATATNFDSMPILGRGVQNQQAEAVRTLQQFMNANTQSDTTGSLLWGNAPAAAMTPSFGVSVSVEGMEYNFQLTQDDIGKVFKRYGNINNVEILPPDNNIAHVHFQGQFDARNAIQDLNGKILNGVQGVLRVVWGLHQTIPRANRGQVEPPAPQVADMNGQDEISRSTGAIIGGPEPSKFNRLLTEWDVQNFFVPGGAQSGLVPPGMQGRRSSAGGDSGAGMPAFNQAKMEDNISRLLGEVSAVSEASTRGTGLTNTAGTGLLGDGRMMGAVDAYRPAVPQANPLSSSLPIRKYTCRFEIGIENDREFQVARRIIGQKGMNMKRIVSISNAKLRLRGQGSGYLEGAVRQESPDPLHLCVSCMTKDGYDAAVTETSALLTKIYSEWRDFNLKKRRADPGFLDVQLKEHFLVGNSGPSEDQPRQYGGGGRGMGIPQWA